VKTKNAKNVSALRVLAFLLPALLVSCAAAPARVAEPAGFAVSENPGLPGTGRMVTVSAGLDLFVRSTERETRAALIRQAGNLGGFVFSAAGASVVVWVPAENMEDFLTYAGTLGNVENERRSGRDITDQFQNDVVRLDSLRNVRARYLALLDRATAVSEMLSIERELERVVLEIERLEARIRQAETSVAYSTVTVRIRERSRPGPVGWVFYGLFRGIRWLFVW